MKRFYVNLIFRGNQRIHRRYVITADTRSQAEECAESHYRHEGPMRLDCFAEVVGTCKAGQEVRRGYSELD